MFAIIKMNKLLNLLIYLFIFIAMTYHWFSSSADTRQAMFYGLVSVFPILVCRILFKIWKK